jgi:hypothetical protein
MGVPPSATQMTPPNMPEGRVEMSANMAGPFPSNLHEGTYEVPGDVNFHG